MSPFPLFQDRTDAGRTLAQSLSAYRGADAIVLGLPRGGVPVAYEVARALGAPLDVCVVRKLGAPLQPELGIGAVAEDGAIYVDRGTMRFVGVSDDELAALVATKRAEVEERVHRFRRGAPPLDVRDRTVIVVDDGVATGGTVRAALQTLRARGAGRLVLAVPVGASESLSELALVADEIVCPHPEEVFHAVGLWYVDFSTTTDDDVVAILEKERAERAASERTEPAPRASRSAPALRSVDRDVHIPVGNEWLAGRLTVPAGASALVLFAHGSGSGRYSPRNRYVAAALQEAGHGTLLLDLLTEREEAIDRDTGHLRFDIDFLAGRLGAATEWVTQEADTRTLAIGYFGASTGAAAALVAAAGRPDVVGAVVSRGGRPDLAGAWLDRVRSPTLLLVGGADREVLALNREALTQLGCEKLIEVVPGATHLFEEPGTLEQVARSAARWFTRHLGGRLLMATA